MESFSFVTSGVVIYIVSLVCMFFTLYFNKYIKKLLIPVLLVFFISFIILSDIFKYEVKNDSNRINHKYSIIKYKEPDKPKVVVNGDVKDSKKYDKQIVIEREHVTKMYGEYGIMVYYISLYDILRAKLGYQEEDKNPDKIILHR